MFCFSEGRQRLIFRKEMKDCPQCFWRGDRKRDLTEKCGDPAALLFGFQLGGGTDIDRSVDCCEQFTENPKKTLFFLTLLCLRSGEAAPAFRAGVKGEGAGRV